MWMKTTCLPIDVCVRKQAYGGEKVGNTYRQSYMYFSGKYLVVLVRNQHFLNYAAVFLGTQQLINC